jgi:hypothetical protein
MTEIQMPLLPHFQNLHMIQCTGLARGVQMNKIKSPGGNLTNHSKGEKMGDKMAVKAS